MASGLWKGVTFLAVAAAVAGATYGRLEQIEVVKATAASQDAAAKLADCARARAEDLAGKDKALTEASASLGATRAELEELRAEHAENEKRLAAFRSLTDKFRKMIDSGKLQIALVHGRMVVKLPAGVLFASGSADLSKDGADALHDVAAVLRTMRDRRFMVAGHTDNLPIVGTSSFKNNLELSTARAVTVAQHLARSGMSAPQLVAAGYAEHEPVKSNATEAGRQENRRIEIVLLPNVTELPGVVVESADAGAPGDAGTRDGGAAKP